jgi:trehalose/maltose hydrolase-like predicted phosphorylase
MLSTSMSESLRADGTEKRTMDIGHIFWDELSVFPTPNLLFPEITRALLLYRHRRLSEARWAPGQAGYQGAMYPSQSGSDGRKESQVVHLNPISGRWIADSSYLQRHVNGAIAYNIWQYYQATGDREFLSYYRAEMILEIARFWASLKSYSSDLERYEIRGIMRPDEYHEQLPGVDTPGLNNNTYTNIMAVWTLQTGLKILAPDRRQHLRRTLNLQVDYYLRRTSYGSTLSRIVHSWVLAQSDRTHSWRLCTEVLEGDISDTQGGTTPEGIHLGAMAGSVDLVQRCYTGIEMRDEVLWLHPCLPADVRSLELQIRYRSHWLTLKVSHEALRVTSRQGWAKTARVGFHNQVYEFEAGDVREFVL